MAISHADHNHPNTPAARAKCRKEMASGNFTMGQVAADEIPIRHSTDEIHRMDVARLTVVPRRRGDGGVVKGLKNAKRTNTLIKAEHDLADVPRMLAYGIRMAWALDLDVKVGERFNDEEKRVVIQADRAEIALVWRDKRPDGIWAVFIRNWDSSKTFKVDSVQQAFEFAAHDAECWDEYGNLVV